MSHAARANLRVVVISGVVSHRVSEKLRLAALARRTDMAVKVLVPGVAPGAGLGDATSTERQAAFIEVGARRWAPGFRSGRVDTVPDLQPTLARLQPDAILVHQEPGSLLAWQTLRARDRVVPVAAVLVESEQTDINLTTGPSVHLERHVLSRADALVVRHKVRLELARAQGFAGYGAVVGYGVDGSVFRPGLRTAAREALGVSGFTIGYLGRIAPESGLSDVLEAMAVTKAPVNLVVKASGDTPAKARDEIVDHAASLDIAERVRFIEPGETADDAAFLSALDALVLMRRTVRRWREPYEHIIPEAQACGVPVIASALSGIPTLVGPGGWLVGERDAGLLARLLQRIATHPEVTDAVATAALAHVNQHSSLHGATQELRRALDTAIQARQISRATRPRNWLGYPPVPESSRR